MQHFINSKNALIMKNPICCYFSLTFCPFSHRLSHCGGVYCYSLIGHMTSFYSLEIFLRTKDTLGRVFTSNASSPNLARQTGVN